MSPITAGNYCLYSGLKPSRMQGITVKAEPPLAEVSIANVGAFLYFGQFLKVDV